MPPSLVGGAGVPPLKSTKPITSASGVRFSRSNGARGSASPKSKYSLFLCITG
jgi:hypothetical protein